MKTHHPFIRVKKAGLFLVVCLLAGIAGNAQNKLDVSLIPDSLKKDANAVIRNSSRVYNRLSVDKYTLEVNYTVTVLNSRGIHAAELAVYYDRNSSVSSIKENIYDAKGNLLKAIKRKDFNDYASNSSYTLYSDNRVIHYKPSNNNYPYTVEYSYTVDHKSTVGFGNWLPHDWFGISTEKAELIVKTPATLELRYKELNHPFIFEKKEQDNVIRYSWSASHLKAIAYEPSMSDYLDIFPVVVLSPAEISYEGTSGNFNSWKNYGDWVYGLINKRDELSTASLDEIKLLTDPISDQKEKVKTLYKYMQQKTRYVNISLGIGGFQPAPATEVHAKGYGDCKALSNYMRALLKGIGVESYYTEIGNGPSRKIKFPEFASANQTNHIILCVPVEQDTIWLECTNQNYPFGYIGTGNSDRYALLVTEQGGKLVRTPVYGTDKNTRTSQLKVDLQENGSALFELNSGFRNSLYSDVFPLIYLSKEDQKKELLKSLSGGGLQIADFLVQDTSTGEAAADLYVKGQIGSYAVTGGTRLFVEPNLLFPHSFPSQIRKNRKQNLYEAVGYVYNDTLSLNIPKELEIEFLPKDAEISSSYGSYKISYRKVTDSSILVNRVITINKGNFSPAEFEQINTFLNGVGRQDKEKIVLSVKKT
ncbi:DUF3857 domain-containing protein [Gaoshiqia sp. Z1-71]|uniref:DUF3857 domain-containing protein n=1 Tax=Gaoshiqia hydrogeniformans TaxID=3290090 RepID=UPI003BF7819A